MSFDSDLGIRIGTIGIAAKTNQVLTVKGQTDVPLQQHIPRTVLGCPTGWIPYAMIIPYKVPSIDTSYEAYPKQLTVLVV